MPSVIEAGRATLNQEADVNDATADPVLEMAVKYVAACDEVLARGERVP